MLCVMEAGLAPHGSSDSSCLFNFSPLCIQSLVQNELNERVVTRSRESEHSSAEMTVLKNVLGPRAESDYSALKKVNVLPNHFNACKYWEATERLCGVCDRSRTLERFSSVVHTEWRTYDWREGGLVPKRCFKRIDQQER